MMAGSAVWLAQKRRLDEVFERAAELFEIRFDVSQNGAPLRRGIAGGAAAAEP
jgi:hypothetical protein